MRCQYPEEVLGKANKALTPAMEDFNLKAGRPTRLSEGVRGVRGLHEQSTLKTAKNSI